MGNQQNVRYYNVVKCDDDDAQIELYKSFIFFYTRMRIAQYFFFLRKPFKYKMYSNYF